MTITLLVVGFAAGYLFASLGVGIQRRRMERSARQLANQVAEYTEFSGSTELPAEWVQDQLDSYVHDQFG